MNRARARTRCTDRDERILCVVPPGSFLVPDRSPEFSCRCGTGELPRRYAGAAQRCVGTARNARKRGPDRDARMRDLPPWQTMRAGPLPLARREHRKKRFDKSIPSIAELEFARDDELEVSDGYAILLRSVIVRERSLGIFE